MASLLDTLLKFGAISTSYFDLGVDAGREDSRSDPTIPKSEYSRAPSASISSKLFEEKLSGRLIIATTDRSDQVCWRISNDAENAGAAARFAGGYLMTLVL